MGNIKINIQSAFSDIHKLCELAMCVLLARPICAQHTDICATRTLRSLKYIETFPRVKIRLKFCLKSQVTEIEYEKGS